MTYGALQAIVIRRLLYAELDPALKADYVWDEFVMWVAHCVFTAQSGWEQLAPQHLTSGLQSVWTSGDWMKARVCTQASLALSCIWSCTEGSVWTSNFKGRGLQTFSSPLSGLRHGGNLIITLYSFLHHLHTHKANCQPQSTIDMWY